MQTVLDRLRQSREFPCGARTLQNSFLLLNLAPVFCSTSGMPHLSARPAPRAERVTRAADSQNPLADPPPRPSSPPLPLCPGGRRRTLEMVLGRWGGERERMREREREAGREGGTPHGRRGALGLEVECIGRRVSDDRDDCLLVLLPFGGAERHGESDNEIHLGVSRVLAKWRKRGVEEGEREGPSRTWQNTPQPRSSTSPPHHRAQFLERQT